MNVKDKEECLRLRKQIFLTGYRGGMAHLASCFSAVEILYTLYLRGILRVDPQNPKWEDRDRFVLSKGHAGLALYSVLCDAGFVQKEELEAYLLPGCHIGGEPCMRDSQAIEATTGSLGHGLSMAVGMAIAQKLDGHGARTFVLLGDGECQEGSIWEAAMSAAAYRLDNLTVILDCNEIQKTARVEEIQKIVNWAEKWSSFGFEITEVDGHDTDALAEVLAAEGTDRPRLIIAHTVKGKGVSVMENNPIWHFKLPGRKELPVFCAELGIKEGEL